MKKYCFTITSLLVLVMGITSCSNEENKTQTQMVARPTVPILDRTVTDVDGNIYKIVTIGNQKWTKTNLNVSHYRNGDPIPQVTDPTQWVNLTTGAWCYYNNDPANGPIYGKLYNWYAVNDPRGLAPTGCHVPSDAEWTALTTILGGELVAGNKMKATAGWTPFLGITNTNSSGFTGLPGLYRTTSGSFNDIVSRGYWWSSSEDNPSGAWFRYLHYNEGFATRASYYKLLGLSVRCLKD
ncbi:fibrobacter succinogenes major paralogous domain-containing protein [Flavobacterium sp.]|uniref:fibrobacter succinogenes major paralogous domain-containing protein n=1 Tax=Flavobacterium sp. TaxID=239 RepID=UPI00286ACA6F|nr:fibrobacter succinogenes major paralogous domain-containing protein [Flavobacterium sp.]